MLSRRLLSNVFNGYRSMLPDASNASVLRTFASESSSKIIVKKQFETNHLGKTNADYITYIMREFLMCTGIGFYCGVIIGVGYMKWKPVTELPSKSYQNTYTVRPLRGYS